MPFARITELPVSMQMVVCVSQVFLVHTGLISSVLPNVSLLMNIISSGMIKRRMFLCLIVFKFIIFPNGGQSDRTLPRTQSSTAAPSCFLLPLAP